jgi:hypothetical protein
MTSADRSGSVCRGPPVCLVLDVGGSGFACPSSFNVPRVQELCVKSLHPGRFLRHVFAFAAKDPLVSEMLQILLRF